MKERKKEPFIWEGLGFPIRLINVPMRKVFGEWVLDINLDHFQKIVLHSLANKPIPLSGAELRFIIDYQRDPYRNRCRKDCLLRNSAGLTVLFSGNR